MKFGTDGVRGAAYTELTAAFAARLGGAAARVLVDPPSGRRAVVVIGGDTRESTPMLLEALASGFAGAGLHVIDLGVATTPQVAFEAQRSGAIGAVVSASHNPFGDNGIKLFGHGGRKLGDDIESRIEAELARHGDDGAGSTDPADPGSAAGPPHGDVQRRDHGEHAAYVDHVLSMLDGRDLSGLRVVLDAANGAGTTIGPEVLRAAGADVHVIADQPDGRNINDHCGATHPALVGAAVVDLGADLGVALDGDADRLIAVDHTGAVVDGDHIIAICAKDLRERGRLRHDTVVVTVMTNLGFRIAMEQAAIRVVETAVGDRYVLEALADGGYSLGGEQSGHVIFADHATTGDGVLTAVALLDVVKRSGPLRDLAADAMTSLPQVLVNVRVGGRVPDVSDRLSAEIAAAEAALGATGRVLVRASGTEPLVRVMVEAPTASDAQATADRLADAARSRFAAP